MATINKVFLVGNAGKDAKVSKTSKGTDITSFSLATHRNRKNDNDEWEQIPEWHSVICYGKVAEAAARVAKGNLVVVEGRLQKNDSEQAFDPYFVIASSVSVVSKPQGEKAETAAPETTGFEDMPF